MDASFPSHPPEEKANIRQDTAFLSGFCPPTSTRPWIIITFSLYVYECVVCSHVCVFTCFCVSMYVYAYVKA